MLEKQVLAACRERLIQVSLYPSPCVKLNCSGLSFPLIRGSMLHKTNYTAQLQICFDLQVANECKALGKKETFFQ